MSRSHTFAPGEFYHIYNRGTEKRTIFLKQGDYDRFVALLYMANQIEAVDLKLQGRTLEEVKDQERSTPLVGITAYCLMPNHFHLLLHEIESGGISKFMQKLSTAYTMYFNKRLERSGALFQGKFKASHVQDDRYLRYLVSYIHLNPVKLIEPEWKEHGIADRKGAEMFLADYQSSSYLDYLNKERTENIILTRDAMPEYFNSGREFKEFVTAWLDYKVEPC